MAMIFKSLSDNINYRKFKVIMPGNYEPVISSYHASGNLPIYQENDIGISFVPIKDIIDMCFKQVEFTICNSQDIATITGIIRRYIESMEVYRNHPEVEIFLDKCITTLHLLSPIEKRVERFEPNLLSEKKDLLDIDLFLE